MIAIYAGNKNAQDGSRILYGFYRWRVILVVWRFTFSFGFQNKTCFVAAPAQRGVITSAEPPIYMLAEAGPKETP